MEIIPLTRDLYEEWDKFCLESDEAWFWHTTDWLEYTLHLRPELKSQSKSFLIMNNNIPVAICPLILNTVSEGEEEYNAFSFDRSGGMIPALGNGPAAKQRETLLKLIFSHIDELAVQHDVKICLLRFSPLAPAFYRQNQYNYLMKFGFLNTSLNTQVLYLTDDLNQINKNIRKGHKHDIHRGEKAFEVNVYDKNNITEEIFDRYRILHHKTAGRVTRPLITFEMMYHWILEGKAILGGASYQGKHVAFDLINVYKDGAFYSSASDDPDVETDVPTSHVMQWRVITWLKENGFRIYEIGLQQFGAQLYDFPSEKDKTISFFKRGFGGLTAPVFSGEKFYSREFLSRVLSNRVEKFVQTSNLP